MADDHDPGLGVQSVASLISAHNARIARIDPLIPPVPAPSASDTPPPGDAPPGEPEPSARPISVDDGMAVARSQRSDPDSLDALWGFLTSYTLSGIRLGGRRPAEQTMNDLLAQWQAWVAERPAGADTSAGLMWPSRDVETVNALLDHGLAARVAVAARPAGRAIPAAADAIPDGVTIRPMEEGDLDGAVDRYIDVVAWDAQFGAVVLRPSAPTTIRSDLRHTLGSGVHSAWVAERDGRIDGLAVVEWPSPDGWFRALANAERVAYLGTMSVVAGQRGTGIGSALSATVHRALDAGGVEVALLHHSISNPLSTPFWHRNGYRPLWTWWSARPHSTLR